jgi:hypothetical protein
MLLSIDGEHVAISFDRLLNLDVGQWCHLNCALWSTEVYETVSGALMCVEQAYKRSTHTECTSCKNKGASLKCFYPRCPNTYHFPCAVQNACVFYKNKVRFVRRRSLSIRSSNQWICSLLDNYVSYSCVTSNDDGSNSRR